MGLAIKKKKKKGPHYGEEGRRGNLKGKGGSQEGWGAVKQLVGPKKGEKKAFVKHRGESQRRCEDKQIQAE